FLSNPSSSSLISGGIQYGLPLYSSNGNFIKSFNSFFVTASLIVIINLPHFEIHPFALFRLPLFSSFFHPFSPFRSLPYRHPTHQEAGYPCNWHQIAMKNLCLRTG